MNVLFLDYDGVVNTPIWDDMGTKCRINNPFHKSVNNFQAVQWVSEFCEKFNYSIVVTSTWRYGDETYRTCLINGGLRRGIKILGKTERLDGKCRGDEIQLYLNEHPEIENFIILDDDSDMGNLSNHLIKCNSYIGFTLIEFLKAKELHQLMEISKS